MACSQPFQRYINIHNKYLSRIPFYDTPQYIPCGWCLNCRKDRQNYFCDRAKYEFKTRLTASFVTFTYDDNHLFTECMPSDDGVFCHFIENTKIPYTTLRYEHLTKFIDNIRHYIKNHPEIQNVLCQPDFSYMYVGEYGDCFNSHRPHFHVLFFGLDFAYCRKYFTTFWKRGLIDVLPLLNGGIEYVTKYMDKQLFGVQAKEEYDNHYISRPRLGCSQGFGKGLLKDNVEDIKNHNYTYNVGHNIRRPISQYWKKLLYSNETVNNTYSPLVSKQQVIFKMKTYDLKDFRKKKRDEFQLRMAKNREEKIRDCLRSHGTPAIDINNFISNRFGVPKIDRDSIIKLNPQCQRDLSEIYLQELLKEV